MIRWFWKWWRWRRVLAEVDEVTAEQFREIRRTVIREQVNRDSRLYAAYCRWFEVDRGDWHVW